MFLHLAIQFFDNELKEYFKELKENCGIIRKLFILALIERNMDTMKYMVHINVIR